MSAGLAAVLADLTTWCELREGALTWTLMSTLDNGRRGFQVFITDNEKAPVDPSQSEAIALVESVESGEMVWFANAPTLEAMEEKIRVWLASQLTSYALAKDDPKIPEFLEALKRSGMRETKCEICGCPLLTRSASDVCPTCRAGAS